MQHIQLYIEGQRVELFKDESVVLTQSIQNVRDIQKVFTDYSKTFTIPATKENNKIFKHYYDNSIENGFDGRKKVDATLELNHLKFRKGKIKLEGVSLKNNLPNHYKVTFYGNTVTLKELLGDDKLGALSGLNAYNRVYDASGIKTALKYNPNTNDVIAPLITHSQRLIYNSVSSDHTVGNLYYNTSNVNGLLWRDLKYAIRVDKVIQEMASQYGFTFSNDFFNSSNTPYYNLFLWLHRKKGDVTSTGTGDAVPQSLVNTWTQTQTDPQLTGMINTSTLFISSSTIDGVNSFTGLEELTLTLKTTSNSPYNVLILVEGEEIFRLTDATGDTTITKDQINPSAGGYNVIIESHNNITFSEINWLLGYKIISTTFYTNFTSSSFTHTNTFEFMMTQQIPDIKCIDFLTGIFKMFNLTAYVDNDTDVVIVKTLDSYYSGGGSYDITEFVDTEKSSVNVALPYKEITFEHEDTKTFLAEQHSQIANKTWAKMEYKSNENLDGKSYKIKTPFSQLKYERLIDSNTSTDTSVQYGYFVNDNQEPYYGKPLLFYPILNSGTNISFLSDGSTQESLASYIVPSNSVALSSSTSKYNMNFNNEINEYTRGNDFTNTLFEAYYKDYISDVFDISNRLTKLTAYLPLRILLNYTLADRFYINGKSYKINTIKTNMLTGKSDLELLNDIYVVPAPPLPPDTTPPTVPSNLSSSSITSTSFTLCWSPSTDTGGVGVKSYQVFQDGVLIQRVSATPIQEINYCANITGLTTSTSYDFTVSATDFNNNTSSVSSALTVTTS